MIKLSKYQNGTLSIWEIKQCDSLQDCSMCFCSLGFFRKWQWPIFLNNGLRNLKGRRYNWYMDLKMQGKHNFKESKSECRHYLYTVFCYYSLLWFSSQFVFFFMLRLVSSTSWVFPQYRFRSLGRENFNLLGFIYQFQERLIGSVWFTCSSMGKSLLLGQGDGGNDCLGQFLKFGEGKML